MIYRQTSSLYKVAFGHSSAQGDQAIAITSEITHNLSSQKTLRNTVLLCSWSNLTHSLN